MNGYKNIIGIVLLIMSGISYSEPVSHISPAQQLSEISVCSCRLSVIDSNQKAAAENLLMSKSYAKLDNQELKILLPGKNIDSKKMLAEEILLAKKEADFRNKRAKEYPSSRSFQKIAGEARGRYEYLQKVALPFHPYLIRSEYYTKSGSYSLMMRGNILTIHHGSLGNKVVELQKEYVVVFLDSEIVGIEVSAGMAE